VLDGKAVLAEVVRNALLRHSQGLDVLPAVAPVRV